MDLQAVAVANDVAIAVEIAVTTVGTENKLGSLCTLIVAEVHVDFVQAADGSQYAPSNSNHAAVVHQYAKIIRNRLTMQLNLRGGLKHWHTLRLLNLDSETVLVVAVTLVGSWDET